MASEIRPKQCRKSSAAKSFAAPRKRPRPRTSSVERPSRASPARLEPLGPLTRPRATPSTRHRAGLCAALPVAEKRKQKRHRRSPRSPLPAEQHAALNAVAGGCHADGRAPRPTEAAKIEGRDCARCTLCAAVVAPDHKEAVVHHARRRPAVQGRRQWLPGQALPDPRAEV